jgi:dihydrofolate reductase
LDGFSAGLEQSQQLPFGKNAIQIMNWFFPTKTFKSMFGGETGTTGIDDQYASKGFEGVGASIMGRNMFSPLRGAWPDEAWKGWWGENPPFKHPVFVRTHYPRPTLTFANGTEFHFVQGGPAEVLKLAQSAAKGRDVKVNGGVSTVREYWKAALIDELHLVMSPVLVGEGERLFEDLAEAVRGYEVTEFKQGEGALHVRIGRKG